MNPDNENNWRGAGSISFPRWTSDETLTLAWQDFDMESQAKIYLEFLLQKVWGNKSTQDSSEMKGTLRVPDS